MQILLATDGSTNAGAALDVVLHRPWQEGTQVRVIAVVEPVRDMIGHLTKMLEFAKLAAQAHDRHLSLMKDLVEKYAVKLRNKFGADKVSVTVLEGKAKDLIVQEANAWGADTIVLGAHGKNEPGDILFGSVPDHVLSHARASVEILRSASLSTVITELEREHPVEEDKYLLALDDTELSQKTLNEVLSRKWPPNSFFKVMSVVEPLPFQAYSGLGPWEGAGSEEYTRLVSKTIEAQREHAKQVVDDAAAKLKKQFPDANVSTVTLEGYAKEQILAAAKDWPADLIIMGSHGRSGIAGFVLGSVSKSTSSNAPCSVLVVHSGERGKSSQASSEASAAKS